MATLLDAPVSRDDSMAVLGLLGAGLASGNFGQGLLAANSYLNEAPDRRMKSALTAAQIANFNSEVAQRNAATQKLTEGMGLLKGILGGTAAPSYQPGQLGSGTMGVLANDNPMAPSPDPARGLAAATPEQIAMAKMYGIDLMEPWKAAKEGFTVQAGTYRQDPYTNKLRYMADPTKGYGLDEAGNSTLLPNFLATNVAIKGGEAMVQERARAANTLLPLEYVNDVTKKPLGGSVGSYLDGQPLPNMGNGTVSPDVARAIRQDAARNGIAEPNVNLSAPAGVESPVFVAGRQPTLGGSLMSKPAMAAEQARAEAAAKLPFETAGKVNETWLKTSYEPTVSAGNAANDSITNAQVAREALRSMGKTGWSTELQASGANVLAGLGLAPESAKNLATNAQKFQSAAMSNLWTTLNAAKGPQTEGDANRAKATYAQLSNSPEANEFILDLAEAKARRDQLKSAFFQQALPIAREKGDLQEVEREWQKRAPSVFSMPTMQRWSGVNKK